MGLSTSHNAFRGAYSAFNRFRRAIAASIGGSYPPHEQEDLDREMWYWGDGYNAEKNPGLYEFFCHSDSEGEISPEKCTLVADDLDDVLSKLVSLPDLDDYEGGHISSEGGILAVTKRFIEGCRQAAAANEPLIFH